MTKTNLGHVISCYAKTEGFRKKSGIRFLTSGVSSHNIVVVLHMDE